MLHRQPAAGLNETLSRCNAWLKGKTCLPTVGENAWFSNYSMYFHFSWNCDSICSGHFPWSVLSSSGHISLFFNQVLYARHLKWQHHNSFKWQKQASGNNKLNFRLSIFTIVRAVQKKLICSLGIWDCYTCNEDITVSKLKKNTELWK